MTLNDNYKIFEDIELNNLIMKGLEKTNKDLAYYII